MCLASFGILCTETGIIGILPDVATRFGIEAAQAGLFPALPAQRARGYLEQVSALVRSLPIVSLLIIVGVQAAIFSTYAYAAEYITEVGGIQGETQSALLLGFGAAGLIGDHLAGRLLSSASARMLMVFPLIVCALYAVLNGSAIQSIVFGAMVSYGARCTASATTCSST
ncbi:hypothetical protein JS533_011040 [Bifidobacterium amazonense]|uniref:Major facilitator superfamily (MFS) profile domain-containing protein n=1 Tax=Bifidobacterium amazonense TaxID=2809027 RepID=A0ABS9VXK6_9BIFI|nr:hypothetical protein [Bifidobacterium amazonense]MCH9276802.1 hypothetical protein [Bifidobacterium amazonense]